MGLRYSQVRKTEWNGEECQARRVIIVVGDCPFPQGWYKGREGTEMRAVEVTYGGQAFYLADEDGNGWHKVTVEGGGPHWGHKSVESAKVIRERSDSDLDEKDCHCRKV